VKPSLEIDPNLASLNPKKMSFSYRPDIDGIRAFAIVAVIAYHAFPELFPGGLIGVDVFFVISGYLITSILVSSLSFDKKPILKFYIRRVRRILPALTVVLVSVYAFGYIALYADEFKELGLHIFSGAAFISNFVYLSEAGYFDHSAELKPLLHLWSLAIEEQFYLCWPVLLLLAVKTKITLTRFVMLLFLASFVISLWLSNQHPSWAYYLPLSRFWEILSGCYLAALNWQGGPAPDSCRTSNVVNPIALLILLSSVFWIDGHNNFPGWQVLPVVLATVWLIRYSNTNHWTYPLLANRGMVALGLISYPLYLWHWPILSFLAITELQTSPMMRLGGLVLSCLLAIMTYKLIERPIRKTAGKTAFALFCGMLFIGFVGYNTFVRNGLDHRQVSYPNLKAHVLSSFGVKQRQWISNQDNYVFNRDAFLKAHPDYPLKLEKVSQLLKSHADVFTTTMQQDMSSNQEVSYQRNRLKVVVIGDSHAGDFFNALKCTHPDIELTGFFDSGCTPIRKRYRDETNRCKILLDKAYDFVKKNPDELIIFAARWPISFYPLADDLQRFSAIARRVAVVGPSLIFSKDVPNILLRYQSGDDIIAYTNSFIEKDKFALNEAMRKFSEDQKIAFIDKMNVFCAEGLCRLTLTGNELFIVDDGHLSPSGLQYFGDNLKRMRTIYRLADKSF